MVIIKKTAQKAVLIGFQSVAGNQQSTHGLKPISLSDISKTATKVQQEKQFERDLHVPGSNYWGQYTQEMDDAYVKEQDRRSLEQHRARKAKEKAIWDQGEEARKEQTKARLKSERYQEERTKQNEQFKRDNPEEYQRVNEDINRITEELNYNPNSDLGTSYQDTWGSWWSNLFGKDPYDSDY